MCYQCPEKCPEEKYLREKCLEECPECPEKCPEECPVEWLYLILGFMLGVGVFMFATFIQFMLAWDIYRKALR